jgi:hypothetical protein
MPLRITQWPAHPECIGDQWFPEDEERLARIVAHILLGRARHAARIIQGAEGGVGLAAPALKQRLQRHLILPPRTEPYHRDGLLFEAICWIAATMVAEPGALLSDPHLQSTQQGADVLKVTFDEETRELRNVTVYEQKCTTAPRDTFRDDVLATFRQYVEKKRDNQIVQITLSLLSEFNLSEAQEQAVYSRLMKQRPISFSAALTVRPEVYTTAQCVALFTDFSEITPNIEDRRGNTFPLTDVRAWFAQFAEKVWRFVEAAEDV